MLRLRSLGGLAVDRSGSSPGEAVTARRRLSVLAVIAAAPSGSVGRDTLMTLFWPESDTERARHALDQSLHWLRRDLKAENLLLGREELSLNPDAITSDVGDFRAALRRDDHRTAVSLYGGPFLHGVFISGAREFERWVDDERAALLRDFERSLESLAAAAVERGDHREAAYWWQRVAAIDPKRTRVMLALMSELATSGDRTGALRQAGVYRAMIRDELDVEPNPAVEALANRLRRSPPITRVGPEGRVFAGRYELQHEMGRGASATVYLARDLPNDRLVALKLFRGNSRSGMFERFRDEIKLACKLQHPYILPIYDSGEADGSIYLVMPYVEGESLRRLLERVPGHRLSVDAVLGFTSEIADALAYAHRQGIVHRDIKPENILLTSGHAVVCDFGLARALEPSSPRHTAPGMVVGTPEYLSPERALTGDVGDPRSDQYSLACLVYEALAGVTPHASDDLVRSMRARATETPRPLDELRADVAHRLAEVVNRALSPNPANRFPDIESFSRALVASASCEPVVSNV